MKINWKKLFDWTIDSVSLPYERYHQKYRFKLVAYQVDVSYRYHGVKTFIFPVGDFGICTTTDEFAYTHAMACYHKICNKMKKVK